MTVFYVVSYLLAAACGFYLGMHLEKLSAEIRAEIARDEAAAKAVIEDFEKDL